MWTKFLDMVTKRQTRKDHSVSAILLIYSTFSNRNQISLFSRKACDKFITMTGKKRWVAHARWWAIAIFQLTELNIKANPPCFQHARARGRAKWRHKSCAERMRNANVRNGLSFCLKPRPNDSNISTQHIPTLLAQHLQASAKLLQHLNATDRNTVECNMLHAFGHHTETCCDTLRVENRTSAHAQVQHCCTNLAKRLEHHATSTNVAQKIWPFSNLSQQHPTCRNTSQQGGQMHSTCSAQQRCDRYVALKCCWGLRLSPTVAYLKNSNFARFRITWEAQWPHG